MAKLLGISEGDGGGELIEFERVNFEPTDGVEKAADTQLGDEKGHCAAVSGKPCELSWATIGGVSCTLVAVNCNKVGTDACHLTTMDTREVGKGIAELDRLASEASETETT
jgi:hypothetical protein